MSSTAPVVPVPPWYRQFWPWFLIALPASAVIAGIATLVIAIENPDGLVVDDYYKQGLAINRVLARDRAAQQLGVAARVSYDPDAQRIRLSLSSAVPIGQPELLLRLTHPTRAHLDRVLLLQPGGDGQYTTPLRDIPPGRWHVSIEPGDGNWRLTGRLRLPQRGGTRLVAGADW
ncbi:MAG TPA: FixH family protein [Gammaproteobacteria bacterium]|nr:FixH family protein [Gammaproteobacteria bacterium]